MAIVNEGDKKVVLNSQQSNEWGEGAQMSTITIANHTSVINSCVPPKFNDHHKER